VPTPNTYLSTRQAATREARRRRFGSQIRRLRLERGLTQEAVANAAGLDRPFLVQIEGGRRSILVERLDDLAKALGVEVAELFAAPGQRGR
jgi:transcriptional regulator with XRE-family HTH domain